MKLYFVRHGETDWNQIGRTCGSTDRPLIETGLQQARQLAQRIPQYPIDVIIASPMLRARQTAEILAEALHLPISFDDRLSERNFGEWEGQNDNIPAFRKQKYTFSNKLPGGESLLQVAQRVYNAIDDIIQNNHKKNVLIVCHGCVMRIAHTYFHSLTQQEYEALYTANCELRVYEAP